MISDYQLRLYRIVREALLVMSNGAPADKQGESAELIIFRRFLSEMRRPPSSCRVG